MLDFETEAILLRRIEYGDHDVIITFMTRQRQDHGHGQECKKSVRRFSGSWICFPLTIFSAGFPRKDAMITWCRR